MIVVPKTPAGVAEPMRLAVSSLPEWVEKEPNDDRAHATRLPSIPAAVSGVIGWKGDVDVYAFRATAGQKLTFDLLGRRLGSRIDSFLRVTDGAGKELASNDDAVGKDSRLEWSPPAAGDYFVEVSDIAGEGGENYGYRLEITPTPAPDFKLTVSPDAMNLGQGGTEVMTVRAERLNGFTGDIALRVEGLPQGVSASPGAIHIPADPMGRESVQITLTAAPDAQRAGFPLRVVGSATVAGKPVERVAEPIETYQPPGEEGDRQRPTVFQVAGVGELVPFTVSVEPRQVSLAPGATATLQVKVTRRPDAEAAKGEVNLDVQNVPEGVEVKAPAIPADKSAGSIELKAPEKLDPRALNLIVRGRIKANKEMKERAQAAPAVALLVTAKPAAAKPGAK
jgi:pre-peptidase